MILQVRFNSYHPFPIEVGTTSNISELKQRISQEHSVDVQSIRIIFQGKELQDHVTVQDCDFGAHTVLHAVKGNKARQGPSPVQTDSDQQEEEFLSLRPVPVEYRQQYYVYCKDCWGMRQGKLRVRCAGCKQGTLTVDRDPTCWQDVLTAGRIPGTCQSEDCEATVSEFYFKCCHHEAGTDQSSVPLCHIRPNRRRVLCVTCEEIQNPILVFPCEVGHSMCLDCFQIYCATNLNDRAFVQTEEFGYTLPCPAGCEESFIEEPHHFRMLGDDQYARYQRYGTEECLLKMGGVLCPTPGCGAGLLPEEGTRRVFCEGRAAGGCGQEFCRECLERAHDGSCRERNENPGAGENRLHFDERQAERAQWERQSRETIRATTKPCPQCNVSTEYSGGCMHMTCSRCKFEWCWLCEIRWNNNCMGDHWFG